MKKVLVISTSLRNNSNSEILANAFKDGAIEAGHSVEFVSLKNKNISFCKGCFACQKTKKCVINDDANEITDKIEKADVIVWATPIYYYEMSGQMKVMIDRANSLYVRDYKFKEVYLLAVAADDDPNTPNRAAEGCQGWIDCFDGVVLKKVLFAGGINDAAAIKGSDILNEAFELGKSV